MLKDYVTVIVSMLLVVSIIGLVEIGNNSVTGDSITGMQSVDKSYLCYDKYSACVSGCYNISNIDISRCLSDCERSRDECLRFSKPYTPEPAPTPPPEKSWWERMWEWLFSSKTAVGTGQDVGLKDLPSDAQGFIKELGGLVKLAKNGVGKIVVITNNGANEYLLPGSGDKALVVLSNIGEGDYNIELKSSEKRFVIKAKVKGTESGYGIGELPSDLSQNPIDSFTLTDDLGRNIAQGPVNNVLGQQPSRRTESRPFFCCKDGRGTEGTGYYEERNSPEDCAGLVSKKCSDSNGVEKENPFIGSYSQSEAARECVYGYKCLNDKIAKLCGDDYTSTAGASNTVEGAQPCPRPKVVRTGDEDTPSLSCANVCAEKGMFSEAPSEKYSSGIMSKLENNDFYCQDILISFSQLQFGKCNCFVDKAPMVSPAGVAVCDNGVKCGEETDGKSCVFKGWGFGEQGMPMAVLSSGE